MKLPPLGFELFTIAPNSQCIAVIGLAHKYNSGGTVCHIERLPERVRFELRDGGDFLAYAAKRPQAITVDRKPIEFFHDQVTGALRVRVDGKGSRVVEIEH